ncbi:MAG: hypothetical protein H6797_02205 [Candidatus Nomurabacteria bacterium]|nr:MAG: hypothetical protein H6797_02205 [Candidatus Nomurabacteria bacterium]
MDAALLDKEVTAPYREGLFRQEWGAYSDRCLWHITYITHYGVSGWTRFIKIGLVTEPLYRKRSSKSLVPMREVTIHPERCTYTKAVDGLMTIYEGSRTLKLYPPSHLAERLEAWLNQPSAFGVD